MATERDLARELLARARDDLAAAQALRSAGEVSDAIVAFHAQQAVEKALKAALAAAGKDFPFTHNLAVLLQLCEDAELNPPAALTDADLLTPYAAQLRYGAVMAATISRERALEFAKEATHWAEDVEKAAD